VLTSEAEVLLATDDPAVGKELQQKFPALLTFPKTYDLTQLRTAPMDAAVSEMWLLGRCRQTIPGASVFGLAICSTGTPPDN